MSINVPETEPVFAARLTPYRSLSLDGFRVLMACIGTICLVVGTVFFLAGLWPMLGFMGLDFLLIYLAFKLNYRSASAYEDVEVSRQNILVRKVAANGRSREHLFPQFGTRFEVDRHDEIGITAMHLTNRSRRLEFGTFLNPADRESFAFAFSGAMSRAKQ